MLQQRFIGGRILAGVVAVALVVFGVWYFMRNTPPSTRGGEDTPTTASGAGGDTEVYASTTQGVRFIYPDRYMLEERSQGTGARRHHVITLMREVGLPPPQNGEGPVSITIQIFPVSGQTVQSWITSAQESNFQLSPDDMLTTTTVAGVAGLRYRWSGLYEGESVALLRGGRVYVFSHTWMEPGRELEDDFEKLIDSVEFAWE